MGYAIAEKCFEHGADVVLISGPVQITPKYEGIKVVPVTTANQMFEASVQHFPQSDVAILSAAVADFSPKNTYSNKVKRGKDDLQILLQPTKDIAGQLGEMKNEKQIMIGFALETDNEIQNAKKKLVRKNFDFIVLNSLNDPGAGFLTDTNKISIIDKNNNIDKFELKTKSLVAEDIVDKLINVLKI